MNTTLEPTQTLSPASTVSATQYRRQFAQLSASGHAMDLKTPAARETVAAQLVSEMAFKPMLAEMRKFPLANNDMFSGGRGEEVFGERLDEQFADIVASRSSGVTADIAERLKPRGGESAEGTSAEAAPQSVSTPQAAWWQMPAALNPDQRLDSVAGEGS